jgi:hypothetical protein
MPAMSRAANLLAFTTLLGVSAIGCVDISAGDLPVVDTVEKRFAVSGAPQVKVGTFDGSVEVSTWDRPEVLVVIEKRAMDKAAADRMLVTAEQNGDRVTVDVRNTSDGGLHLNFGSIGARVTVTVPAKAQIEASTGDGRVNVRDVEGDLSVRTGDGAIRLEHVNGAVDAQSGDGSIEIEGMIRRLTARSGDGRVRVNAANAHPSSDWTLATGDGSVVLDVPEGFSAELDATTGDGRVEVRGLPFSGSSNARARRAARGQIGSGGARITIRSGDGSITVRRSEDGTPAAH